uniref:Uncharacterized protein n=1 Tax=Pararge aegeria TaxID=116150 RepID=S4P2D7_9NEOP
MLFTAIDRYTNSAKEREATAIVLAVRAYFTPKTLTFKSHRHRRRDGVHDASSEERLGYIQLSIAADFRVCGQAGHRRRPGAQGVRVSLRGTRPVTADCAQPPSQRSSHALALLLPRTAEPSFLTSIRKPKGLG